MLSVKGLLFMALIALPLAAVSDVVAGVEDVANIADRLIDFLVRVTGISLIWSVRRLASSTLLARIDRVVAS